YEFSPVFWNSGKITLFRDPTYYLKDRRTSRSNADKVWGKPHIEIDWQPARPLTVPMANQPTVGSLSFMSADDRRIDLYFPVKTLNVDPNNRKTWQVCTGPVIVPDRESIELAF